jgi:hypothetical protein
MSKSFDAFPDGIGKFKPTDIWLSADKFSIVRDAAAERLRVREEQALQPLLADVMLMYASDEVVVELEDQNGHNYLRDLLASYVDRTAEVALNLHQAGQFESAALRRRSAYLAPAIVDEVQTCVDMQLFLGN